MYATFLQASFLCLGWWTNSTNGCLILNKPNQGICTPNPLLQALSSGYNYSPHKRSKLVLFFYVFFLILKRKTKLMLFLKSCPLSGCSFPLLQGSCATAMSALLSGQYNVPSSAFPSYMTSASAMEELQLSPQNQCFHQQEQTWTEGFWTHLFIWGNSCLVGPNFGLFPKETILSAKPPVLTFDLISHLQSHLLVGQSS